MHGPEHWHCGRAPQTSAERLQAEVEAMYAREERRARFNEAPTTISRRMCGVVGCENPADASGVFCTECWKTIGPYDRPINE